MTTCLQIPDHLHRNSTTVVADGVEETGFHLINLATARLGLSTLADQDVLDVGCGVRFAQAIVNRQIPIRSYTGVEVYRPIVEYMRRHLEPFESRFQFIHWDVRHGIFSA